MRASGDVINQQATSTSALADPVGGMKDGSSTRHSKNIKEVFVTRLVNGRLVSKSTKCAGCVLKRDQTYLCKHFLRGGTSCLNIWRQGGGQRRMDLNQPVGTWVLRKVCFCQFPPQTKTPPLLFFFSCASLMSSFKWRKHGTLFAHVWDSTAANPVSRRVKLTPLRLESDS